MIAFGVLIGAYAQEPEPLRFAKAAEERAALAKPKEVDSDIIPMPIKRVGRRKEGLSDAQLIEIRAIICDVCGLPVEEFISVKKEQRQVTVRCIFASIAKQLNPLCAFRRIGAMMGGRNHSSAMYVVGIFEKYCADEKFKEKYNACVDAVSKFKK